MRHDLETGIAIAIDDSSQIGEARRSAGAVAAASGLSATEAGRFAIIATEAATNIAKHAARGEIMLRSVVGQRVRAVDLVAIDSGPGIPDLDRALSDGYSTAGSPGHGLGAMARLATDFDIFTGPGIGTVLTARIEGDGSAAQPRDAFEVGAVRVPKRGESECGDSWGIVVGEDGRATLTVADGLGHGPSAAEASWRAVELGGEHAGGSPSTVIAAIHAGLRRTRGAAVAVAELAPNDGWVRFCGLGNIAGAVVGPHSSRSFVSLSGIAGHEMRKIQEFEYPWPTDALVILHSDGISPRWDLARYPGLAQRRASVVAGVLYRDFSRGRDDALVVVVRSVTRDTASSKSWRR